MSANECAKSEKAMSEVLGCGCLMKTWRFLYFSGENTLFITNRFMPGHSRGGRTTQRTLAFGFLMLGNAGLGQRPQQREQPQPAGCMPNRQLRQGLLEELDRGDVAAAGGE